MPYHEMCLDIPDDASEKQQALVSALNQVAMPCDEKTMYIFAIATCNKSANVRNSGLAKHLIEASISTAKELGFTQIVADVTNHVSQHIFLNHYGFQVQLKADYVDIEYNHRKWFESIHPPTKSLMRVSLTV
jgi:N-acetylglutamate synthase-like GNAT family acetyltransferase